jgi:hypothetical protein
VNPHIRRGARGQVQVRRAFQLHLSE